MHKYKIELVTIADITKFVNIVGALTGKIQLCDGEDFCVNAKSLLGAMVTVEWSSVYCYSETPIYSQIQEFVVE